MIDWSDTAPEDPHGYRKLCAFLEFVADAIDDLGDSTLASDLRVQARGIGSPSEWMGEAALALDRSLAISALPPGLRTEVRGAVEAIREGFRKIGPEPSF